MTTPPEPGTPVPALPVLEYVQPGAIEPARAPVPGVVRVLGAVAGIVVPLVCFVTSFFGIPLGPEWQSCECYDYVRLLLWPRGGWPSASPAACAWWNWPTSPTPRWC